MSPDNPAKEVDGLMPRSSSLIRLAERQRIVLSNEQFSRFVKMLEDQSPPTSALQKAMMDYQAAKAACPDRGL